MKSHANEMFLYISVAAMEAARQFQALVLTGWLLNFNGTNACVDD